MVRHFHEPKRLKLDTPILTKSVVAFAEKNSDAPRTETHTHAESDIPDYVWNSISLHAREKLQALALQAQMQ